MMGKYLSRRHAWERRRREFVYLDETSVISLVAARHGSIAETFKDTHSENVNSQLASQISTSSSALSPGIGLNSNVAAGRTTTQEVVRRSVVQGTFRHLRLTDDDLSLSVEDQKPRRWPRRAESSEDLEKKLKRLAKQRRAVRVGDLKRGDVVELRVELSADPSYQFTAAATSMLDMIDGQYSIFGITEAQFAKYAPMLELLPKMLVDLVPINAQVVSHVQVAVNGESWIVDATAIAHHSELKAEVKRLSVAGVTELPSFWKDTRRVLFDQSEYTVYARVAKPGLDTTWSPIKIADVFDSLATDFGAEIRKLPAAFEATRADRNAVAKIHVSELLVADGLIPFGLELARLTGRRIGDDELRHSASMAAREYSDHSELDDLRRARDSYDTIVRTLEACPPLVFAPIDRDLVAAIREPLHDLVRLKAAAARESDAEVNSAPSESGQQLLEVEFVAIYW
ncbi:MULTISPECIES: DUF6414 family protein [Dietzia]|uniref:Uncharacterized protein n=1 Tax=Dietzia maris TaxID=37915 RepID=A0ABT8H563_9ACTN|nr:MULTISPECIES: hypothetical protein [Dietzia]MCZ4656585.1 hypothetical protein [Dietzia kunjamensis]MDN4507604.1 hypothetical protein [Dietzia maris]